MFDAGRLQVNDPPPGSAAAHQLEVSKMYKHKWNIGWDSGISSKKLALLRAIGYMNIDLTDILPDFRVFIFHAENEQFEYFDLRSADKEAGNWLWWV